jgi:hypothetical protein
MFSLGSIAKGSAGGFALVAAVVAAALAATTARAGSDEAQRANVVRGTWSRIAGSPVAPDFGSAMAVWTGRQVLVFGRDTLTKPDAHGVPYAVKTVDIAASYAPATRRWTRLHPPSGSSLAPGRGAAVWTGSEMLVWSGGGLLGFRPATNRWRRLPRAPAGGGLVVWTGRELIGWGGGCCGDASSDGAAYDPRTNRWRRLPHSPLAGSQEPAGAWTGRELVVLVGNTNPADGKPWPARFARAAAYDPATDSWRRIARPPEQRDGASAVWDGREVLLVGGTRPRQGGSPVPARTVLAYDPRTGSWRRLAPLPRGRSGAVTSWTGKRLLVWGGMGGKRLQHVRDGYAYDPARNRWELLPSAPLPRGVEPAGVWTGRSLTIWGGVPTETWGRYRPAAASFTPTAR